jgi:hypothetical protein
MRARDCRAHSRPKVSSTWLTALTECVSSMDFSRCVCVCVWVCVCVCVCLWTSQGMASNLLEVTWKGHLRLLHESPTAYSSFMGDVATYTGVVTMAMMVRRSSEHPGPSPEL